MWSFNAIDDGYCPIGPGSCGIIKPPNVVSISYYQDEATVSFAYAQRQCLEYGKVRYVCDQFFLRFSDFAMQLGMMGTSVIYCSGDKGVAGIGTNTTQGFDICLNSKRMSPAS